MPLLLQLQPRLPPTEVAVFADLLMDIVLDKTTEAAVLVVVPEVAMEAEETEDADTEDADMEDVDPMEEDALDASLPLLTMIRSTATLLLLLLKPLWLPLFPKPLQFLPTPAIRWIPPRDAGSIPLRDTGSTTVLESRTPLEVSTTDAPDAAGTIDPRRMLCRPNMHMIATT
jgi:hypothetical protein